MSSQNKNIYLTIVVASRNDDHGGNLLARTRLFFSTLLEQIDRYRLSSEIILVEWNPPPDRRLLSEVLDLPRTLRSCDVRIITVPHEIHMKFDNAQVLQLHQYIAKNVGLKRACGEYVLATNIDILFSEELIKYLAAKQLNPNQMIRLDRYDVPSDINLAWDAAKVLQYCRKNTIRAYKISGTFETGLSKTIRRILSPRALAGKIKRSSSDRPIHTNACGDFTLMSRDNWLRVGGYPELPFHGYKLDSLLCYSAVAAGVQPVNLKKSQCIYHIEHQLSWTPDQVERLRAHLADKEIPIMNDTEYQNLIDKMLKTNQPVKFNDDTWGLVNETLGEVTFCRAPGASSSNLSNIR